MNSIHTEELVIAAIQADVVWENEEDNLLHYSRQIDIIKADHSNVDLIVLPEMFSTGFTMNPMPLAETMNGAVVGWMKDIAVRKETAICGSIIIEENGKFYNRFVFVKPHQEVLFYDKKHLFKFAGENQHYAPGNKKLTIEYKGWKITPFVCYDLRFPVWCRNTEKADVLLFVANWPETRIGHWQKLLPARAIENQCYVIGVNRVGTDSNNLNYIGQSTCIDPMGNVVNEMGDKEGYGIFNLQRSLVSSVRQRIPFLDDMDEFVIS